MRRIKEKISIDFNVEYDEVEWKGGWIPKTVYKYRDWENKYHRSILESLQIWVPDSFDFNDPFDCNIPVAYDMLLDDGIAAEFIRQMILKKGFNGDIEQEVQDKLKEGRHKNLDFLAQYKKSVHESNRKMHGVFSVTPINTNILMWSHYASNHKGFCVGFDSVILFDYLGGGGKVKYDHKFPQILPVEDRDKQYIDMILTKSIHWAYEVEYRLTTFGKTNLNIPFPKEAITEVIFGARMKQEIKHEIKGFLSKNLPHVKCLACVPHENDFVLDVVPFD